MILYVNGDSHAAGAEAVNECSFAEDDSRYQHLGRRPHPDNLEVSYGAVIAKTLGFNLVCEAESASSNARILRTTREYLQHNKPDLILIGWTTWEREEWLYEGRYWQINAGGFGQDWPEEIKNRYPEYVQNSNYQRKMEETHDKIWDLKKDLDDSGYRYLFFNFFHSLNTRIRHDWGHDYVYPYEREWTYYNWLIKNGHQPNPNSQYHFGKTAHQAWAQFLIPLLTSKL